MAKDYTELYAKVTDTIIEQMEQGVIPWKKGWTALTGKYNVKSKRRYSFLNQMILKRQGAYASYKQWQEKGCQVVKGAKAEYVMEWFSKKHTREVENEDGNIEEKQFLLWYPRFYPVFHESQVDGYEHEELTPEQHDPIADAEKVIDEYIAFSGIKGINRERESDSAYYTPTFDSITVPTINQFSDVNEYYGTLFHEMTHSTGHKERLDRLTSTHFGSSPYAKEELVAEFGSAMCLARLGIDTPKTTTNSVAYLQSWLKVLKNDKTLLVSAVSFAETSTRYIFHESFQK